MPVCNTTETLPGPRVFSRIWKPTTLEPRNMKSLDFSGGRATGTVVAKRSQVATNTNLVHLIKQLRKEFDAPEANFVCASLAQTEKGAKDGGGKILEAVLAVDGSSGKYPEFKGNVAAVYTHPLSKGGSSGSHYGGNAETYMNVGEAMGRAMLGLMKGGE